VQPIARHADLDATLGISAPTSTRCARRWTRSNGRPTNDFRWMPCKVTCRCCWRACSATNPRVR
jgi:hypothetical protein